MATSSRWTTERRRQAKLTALVIASDDDLRDALRALFDDLGYVATAVTSTDAAPEDLSRFSILFFDIGLHVDAARAYLAELSRREATPPTVVCSDRAHAETLASEFGVASIRKPFELEHLAEVVDDAIGTGKKPKS